MALILCLETATAICSVAITDKGEVLIERTLSEGQRHSSMLAVLIKDCLEALNLEMKDLDAVAISDGPGSYTGLRVGSSTAKGICYAIDIPLIAVPTLQSLAYRHKAREVKCIAPMIDARRMEVYTAFYDSGLNVLKPTFNLILTQDEVDTIIDRYDTVLVCGDGAQKCCDNFSPTSGLICIPDQCNASLLSSLSYESYINKAFQNIAYYRPFYYKKPNITRGKTYFSG